MGSCEKGHTEVVTIDVINRQPTKSFFLIEASIKAMVDRTMLLLRCSHKFILYMMDDVRMIQG